ncbi:MAG: hypothetical protein RJB11_2690 [Planctomycetota bacterium]|jgi:hypothetical protein
MLADEIEKTTKFPMRYGFGIGIHGKTTKKIKGSGCEPIFSKNLQSPPLLAENSRYPSFIGCPTIYQNGGF